MKFDEYIKDRLVYQGYNRESNPNKYGLIYEYIIDKMKKIITLFCFLL